MVINGGNDATTGNGGGFDPGGCTFATDGALNTTTKVFTSASYNFTTNDTGHWVYIASGTNWIPGWYQGTWDSGVGLTLTLTIGSAQLLTKGLNTVANCVTGSYSTGTASASWTMDYSRGTTARYTFTDATTTGAVALFTSVANPPTVNMVGNIISWSSGTNFTVQRVQILSVTASVATCDKNVTTGIGATGTGKLGAAFASIGMAGSVALGSNGIWVKFNATAFSSTSTTSNVTVGRLTFAVGTSTANSFIRGFDTVCGDETANRPTLKWDVNAGGQGLVTLNTSCRVENLIFDGNQAVRTSTLGINSNTTANQIIRKCKFLNFNNRAIGGIADKVLIIDCEFLANVTTAAIVGSNGLVEFRGCSFHDNTITCITITTGTALLSRCVFYNNTGAGVNNVQTTGAAIIRADQVVMGTCGGHGFDIQAALAQGVFTNTYVQGAGGWGWNFGTAMDTVVMLNCGAYNNTSGNFDITKLTNSFDQIGFLLPSADVFNNLAGGDLTLNNTAGAGALLKAAGWPSVYAGMTGTNYPDVGAYQHQDAGGSGGNTILAGSGQGLVIS